MKGFKVYLLLSFCLLLCFGCFAQTKANNQNLKLTSNIIAQQDQSNLLVKIENQNFSVQNPLLSACTIRIIGTDGIVVSHNYIHNQTAFNLSLLDLKPGQYYYTVKTKNHRILKGSFTTLPNNHLANL
ncbi:MAG: hypothetical protein ACPGLV_09915 [Bacteroidia bacterium]